MDVCSDNFNHLSCSHCHPHNIDTPTRRGVSAAAGGPTMTAETVDERYSGTTFAIQEEV